MRHYMENFQNILRRKYWLRGETQTGIKGENIDQEENPRQRIKEKDEHRNL